MSTIPTPPASTLSSPSDTELNNNTPETMTPLTRPIYLIVATAVKPPMGIGLRGALPWPSLKKDMTFFRRVTSRSMDSTTSGEKEEGNSLPGQQQRKRKGNAVLMGRRTWESIPVKFRPLRGRVNVVVTRDAGKVAEADDTDVLAVGGVRQGLKVLEERDDVGRTFVIGGAQIYEAVMELKLRRDEGQGLGPLRILQTQVRREDGGEIECDAFFPLKLDDSAEGKGWRRVSGEEVEGWVDGEAVPGNGGQWEVDGESGMQIRVVGWERQV